MISKTLKTTNGTLKVTIPTILDEITLGQMIELQENPSLNDVGAISILSGIAVNDLQNVLSIDELMSFGDYIAPLSYQITNLYNSDRIPKAITFSQPGGPVTVGVTNNLSVEPAGAFMAAREIIADEINEHINATGNDDITGSFNPSLKACCLVLAHYFYCRVTGKNYNEYEAEEFCTEIKKLRVTEALPISKHFFTCYPNLSKQKTSFWHRLQLLWRKRQAFNRLKNLNISIQ